MPAGSLGYDQNGNQLSGTNNHGFLLALILGALQNRSLSESGAANTAPAQQTSTNAAVQLLEARPTRRGASIVNTDAANTVWIGGAGVTNGNGFPLKPGATLNISYTGATFVIDNGSHAVVAVWDEYD